MPAALPQLAITIVEKRGDEEEDENVTYELSGAVEDSTHFFTLEPERRFWSETRLAPTYWDDTNVLKTLSVTTLDHRASFAKSAISIAASLGVDLTFDGAPDPCSYSLSGEAFAALMPAGPEETRRDAAATGAVTEPSTQPCTVTFSFGAVPPDAMPVTRFRERFASGDTVHVAPYAACRRVDAAISNAGVPNSMERVTFYAPDPDFVRVALLPYKGTMSFAETCTPPAISDGAGPEKTDAEVIAEILAMFRDSEE